MRGALVVMKRELAGYFNTPLAYIFIVIFLFLTGIFTFYLGNFFPRGQADLRPFFMFHPWLYLFLVPAISMRLWAEERRQGSIELLLTLPMPLWATVVGKFLAAWAFCAIALALTFPMWITVGYLGAPDHGVIVASYIGSLLLAGGYLAIGGCISAATKNQVIAFVVAVVVSFLVTVSGAPIVLDFFTGWAPQVAVDAIASFSFLTRFQSITEGVIDVRDLVYFVTAIGLWLYATLIVVEARKAG
ncbi:MAG: ABC transporter permease subunit [Alphaproteobacteria bacterium]